MNEVNYFVISQFIASIYICMNRGFHFFDWLNEQVNISKYSATSCFGIELTLPASQQIPLD